MAAVAVTSQVLTGPKLERRILFAYGLPGLVTAIPTVPVFTLLPVFYAGEVGVGLALTGMVLFLSRALDVVTDPLIGFLTDRAGPGGLKTLLLTGALIAAPALVLLLSPPQGAGAGWLFLCSALLFLGWTLVQIPYLAWGARLSPHYHERTRLTASRETAVIIGILLSGSLPALLTLLQFDEAGRLALTGWFAVALGIPAFTLLLRGVPAPPALAAAGSSWRGLTQNRLFLRLLTAWFLNALANAIPAILFPLYCSHVLATDEQTRNLLLGLYFSSAVIGIPAWLYLSRRLGKHRAWSLAMLLTCPAFAVAAFLSPGDAGIFAVVCLLTGLCLGADMALPPAIQADVADWDRLRFRRNRTAGLFSLWNMATKLALAAAAGVLLPALAALGIEQATPSASALTALAMIYALLPCVFKLSAIGLVSGLPITPARQLAIATRLLRRDAG
jgi:Na+/melibiose symporter-like transporter